MTAFVANARVLAQRFKALVLIVHHVGLGDDKRMRGHSSLNGALDAQILCERKEGELAATLTLQKLKDDASDVRLSARMSRIVIGYDEDGEELDAGREVNRGRGAGRQCTAHEDGSSATAIAHGCRR